MLKHKGKWIITSASTLLASLLIHTIAISGGDRPTQFTNKDSVANSRHNMTQSTMLNGQGVQMNSSRNNYGEVCVYCHTPHGSNADAAMPLWNRKGATAAGSFTKYVGTPTLEGAVSAPGSASLTCLSCHDGQTSIDSVLNMPGPGKYNPNPDNAFLDTWGGPVNSHAKMADVGCQTCHQPGGFGALFPGATDFTVFVIGTDLRNDHPIGIPFPGGSPDTTGFKAGYLTQVQPTGKSVTFYDNDSNGKLSKKDPRFYDNKVECASCHDPHGVPSAGSGSTFYPTFLRVTPAGSAICLSCHAK